MKIDTMNLNSLVDDSAPLFVCSSLTTVICYYGFLTLCEPASFTVAFSARKYYSTSQFLFDAMNIFFSIMHSLILPVIRKVCRSDGDGILKVDVTFDTGRKSHTST